MRILDGRRCREGLGQEIWRVERPEKKKGGSGKLYDERKEKCKGTEIYPQFPKEAPIP